MPVIDRRSFVRVLGKGSTAVIALGLTACGSDGEPDAATTVASTTGAPGSTSTTIAATSTTSTVAANTTAVDDGAWGRVALGSVSAFVVVRSGEAAVIDTGTPGSAEAIAAVLTGLGSSWEDVSHVVATHSHGDHIGSLAAVLDAAPSAIAYAGAPDIPAIGVAGLQALADGDRVFGLDVIATPGHTPGHISLLDPALGVLFAGDAMNGADGGVTGANPRFTPDMATANESIRKMAGFEFEAIGFGHGEPVSSGGSGLVAELAASL